MVDKRVPAKRPKGKTIRQTFNDRLPFFGAMLLAALVTIWVGLTLNTLFKPRQPTVPSPSQQTNQPPISTPAPTAAVPPWFQQTVPLPTAPLPGGSGATTANPQLPGPTGAQTPSPAFPKAATQPAGFPLPQARYGHLPYQESELGQLVEIGTYGSGSDQRTESLDKDAAAAFAEMVAVAEAEGIRVIPISGFRTIADQEKLFQRQIRRQGSESAAAQLSAPPGYSEHHTGYAIDVGDGNQPSADLKFAFEETPAYQWMRQNAGRYGFELSFPENNAQGVSFEPWHWRYVGSGRANAIFRVAHTLQGR